MNLFRKLFPKAAELQAANDRITVLEFDKGELTKQNKALWESYNAHDATVQKQRTEIAELKAKLREQTDADLLLVSARIAIAILKGNKPEQADLALHHSLVAQQASLRPYADVTFSSPYVGSMLQGLGLGNVFGR